MNILYSPCNMITTPDIKNTAIESPLFKKPNKYDALYIRGLNEEQLDARCYVCEVKGPNQQTTWGMCISPRNGNGCNKDVSRAIDYVASRLCACSTDCVHIYKSNIGTRHSSYNIWNKLGENEALNLKSVGASAKVMRKFITGSSFMILSNQLTKDLIMYLITGNEKYRGNQGEPPVNNTASSNGCVDNAIISDLPHPPTVEVKATWFTCLCQWLRRLIQKLPFSPVYTQKASINESVAC